MKLRKVSKSTKITLSILASFPFLALATLVGVKLNQKRALKVGDILENGSEVVKVGIEKDKLIKYKPFVTPTDTYYSKQKQYSLSNVGDIETTWDYYTGEGTMIAIIDSGFTYGHEDFTKNGVSTFSNKSAYFHVDDDENPTTVVKDMATSDGWECMKHEYDDEDYYEWDTHGSNVAGCAAAAMNGVGTVGIAPDATILALKIDFWDASINAAIEYAADQGADVINMSLGAYDTDDPHNSSDSFDGCAEGNADAIAYAINKGCIVVAAAGNESTNAKSYPACNQGVIGVGALAKNSSTSAASFSNFNKNSDTQSGNHNVDVMAPGVVWAPGLDGDELDNSKYNYPSFGYGETQGTSFASPITAGAAALWKQKYPSGTPAQFEADLYSRSVDMGNFTKYGNGRLDVYRLLDIANEGFTLSTTSLSLNTHSEDTEITATSKAGTIASWASNNTNVVTVSGTTGSASGTATVHVVGSGTAKITVTDNHSNVGTINVTVAQYVDVTGVTLNKNTAEVALNKTITLAATVQPTNATNKNITWSSENTGIATVNNGVVTPVALGTTNIVVTTTEGGFTAQCAVTVKEASAEPQSGEILFGTSSGRTSVNATSVTGEDSLGNEWTITTAGTSSFTEQTNFSQIGSKNNPASSINFTTTLESSATITEFSVDLGGFSGTAGTVTLSVDNITVGTGSLSLTDDVTIEMSEDSAEGQVLKVSITNISKGVKAYGISYTYVEGGDPVSKTSMQKAYEAVSALSSGTTTSKSYTFTGIITGKVGNSFYMQDGAYGMYIYAGGTSMISDSAVGHEATVTAKLTNYNGMYETASNTATVNVSSNTGTIEPLTITSYDALAAANQNLLASLTSGVVKTKQSKASTTSGSTSDWKVVITVGNQDITVFGSRYLSTMNAINTLYDTLKVGDYISISNMETSVSNNNIQLALTDQSNITIGYSLNSFCEEFLGNIICNANGTSAPAFASGYSWAQFATLYAKLSSSDQSALTNASATGSELINQVVARYDYIVGKYGTATYSDFMNRNPASLSNSIMSINNNNGALVLLITITSVLIISAGALLLMLKKYKKQ